MRLKKILSLLLAMTLFSCVGITAMAEEVDTWDQLYDAIENGDGNITLGDDVIIGEKSVATYEDLVAALESGEAVKLTADIVAPDKAVLIINNQVVNLGGHSLTLNGESGKITNGEIKNGKIIITTYEGDTVADGVFDVYGTESKVTDVEFYSEKSAIYALFDLKEGDLTFDSCKINMTDNDSAGGLFYFNGGNKLTMSSTIVDGTNIGDFISNGTVELNDCTINLKGTVAGGLDNGINGAALTLNDTNITIDGATGRGITTDGDDIAVNGTSSVNLTNCAEGGIRFKASAKITVAETASLSGTVKVDSAATDAKINDTTVSVTDEELPTATVKNGVTTVGTEKTAVAKVGDDYFTDIQEAIVAAAPNGTVEIVDDVVVDEWIMFSERLGIGSGQIITIDEINGLTIDGKGHSLTINGIESASNGNRLFYDATNLNVKDLTINYADGVVGGIGLTSGTISNVTFNGGVGILPGEGNITITGCKFNTSGSAIYNETDRDNLVVTDNHFKTAAGQYAIYLRGNTTFSNNTVVSGKVNVTTSATGEISGNDFGQERFKVYNGATATISNNTINNLVFNDETTTAATFTNNTMSEEAQTALNAVSASVTPVATKAELDAAIAAAQEGDTILLTDDIDYAGTASLEINKAITLDLGGKTLTTYGTYGGLRLMGDCSIKNGTLAHKGTVTAIKAWNVKAIEDLVIDVAFKAEGKTIGGIVIQENAAGIKTIKNVTIKGEGLTNGIETYNCGNATSPVIGSMENVTIDAKATGMLISAPCGTATNCTISGGKTGIELWIKGTYSATLDLKGCTVDGDEQALFIHDEFTSNAGAVNNGTLKLTADDATTFENEKLVMTIARAENLAIDEDVLKMRSLQGTGAAENPYIINNLNDLKWFRDDVNAGDTYAGKTVTLIADIDLAGEEWTPIAKFEGVFDGAGHTISNLVVNGEGKSNQGFFAETRNGEIKNVTFNNAKVSGRLNVGVVAGTPYTSKYTNIKITGHVEVNGMSYVGGMGGKNGYANITDITIDVDSTSYVKATSTENGTAYRTYVGGVIGFMGEGSHTVKNVTSNINVIGDVCDIGGIVGIAHYGNNFENVVCAGNVTNTNTDAADSAETGGIAGVWHNQKDYTVTFTNCSFNGKVTATGVAENAAIGAAYNATNNSETTSGSLVIDGEKVWPIPELPTATVTEVDDENAPELTFALNFKADEVTDDQLAYYGDWYADFVLEINKDVTFNANGNADGYLAGQYDVWSENWVSVPFKDVTISAGSPLKIMEYAATLMGQSGLKLTYNDVYSFVKDFDCGVFFNDEYIAANPDLEVTLELRMYNPKDESESYAIGETYVFDESDMEKVAEIDGVGYVTLQSAIAAAEANNTIVLLDNVTEDVTIDKSITIEGANKEYTGNINVSGNVDVTIQNVNFVKGYIDHTSSNTSGNLIVKGCSFANGGYAVTTSRINSVTIEDCTVTNQSLLYAKLSTQNITVKNVNISGGNYVAHIVYGNTAYFENVIATDMTGYGICTQNYGAKTITLKNCSFDAPKYYALAVRDDRTTAADTFIFQGENSMSSLYNSEYAKYVLAEADATLKAPEGLNVTTDLEGYVVKYADGTYSVQEAPVVAPAGTISKAYTIQDSDRSRIYGEITGMKASESVVIELYSGETLLATSTLANKDYLANSTLSYNIVVGGRTSSSWTTVWEEGHPIANIVPDTVVLYIDKTEMNSAEVTMDSKPDNLGVVTDWTTLQGVTEKEEVELFDFTGATVTLGNAMQISFFAKQEYFDGEDYFAIVEHVLPDGTTVETRYEFAEWDARRLSGVDYYAINYSNLAARQIADEIRVTIYRTDANQTQVSNTWVDGLSAYAYRTLEKTTTDDKLRTALVDMLNYGAAAQLEFGYNTENLANANAESYQKYATTDISHLKDERVPGSNFVGTTLTLKNNIQLTGYFKNLTSDMHAVVNFKNHYGDERTLEVSGSDFVKYNETTYGVCVDNLVVADAAQLVTITVYNADGTVYGTVVDSINGYLKRSIEKGAIYEATAKFTLSAYNTLH